MEKREKVIAIDGPSGSGKSTVAKAVATELDYLYIDTGALYRGIAWALHKQGVEFVDSDKLNESLNKLDIIYGQDEHCLISINGENLTEQIRQHYVSDLASKVSQLVSVRDYLLDLQRRLVSDQYGVMEGRDIGTVIFPQAFCKVFLTAGPEIRAKRRFEQLLRMGHDVKYEDILNDLLERDKRDKSRDIAPLKKAQDAFEIDTSELSIDEVVTQIVMQAKLCLEETQ